MKEYWENCRNRVRAKHPNARLETNGVLYYISDGYDRRIGIDSLYPADAWIVAIAFCDKE